MGELEWSNAIYFRKKRVVATGGDCFELQWQIVAGQS